MNLLLIVLAIALLVGLFFVARSTFRYIRYSDASSDPDVGVNPQADYRFGTVGLRGTPVPRAPVGAGSDEQADETWADGQPLGFAGAMPSPTTAPLAPMQVGAVFGNPGGRQPVTRYDIPVSLTLTLPELLQGRRRDLIDGEEACSIVAAGRLSSSDADRATAARVAALRDDVSALDAVLLSSAANDIDDAVLDQAWIYVVLNRLSVSWDSYPKPRDILAASILQFEWLDTELSTWLTILDDEFDEVALDATWRQRLNDDVARRATSFAVRSD